MLLPNDSQSSLAVSEELSDSMAREIEERCRLSPVSRLPAELMISILQKLPKTSDLLNCMLVSRGWARNAVGLLWHRPQTTSWVPLQRVVQSLRSSQTAFDYHHFVKRLNLSHLGNQVSDGALLPFQHCNRIERLTLTNCEKLSDLSIARVIDGNRSLMALDVSNIAITDVTMDAIARNCYRLQGLNISNCRRVGNEALVAVAENCHQLKRLKFNGCSQIDDSAIVAFARNCRMMLEIDLVDCSSLEDEAVTALMSECRHLRELRLSRCIRIDDLAFLNLPTGAVFESLRVLDLTDCSLLQDAGIQKIVEVAPRLRNLVLAKCRLITDRAIMAITRLGKNLHYIHLGHCSRITDAGVTQLVRHCNRIRYVDLACCDLLTDASITELATLPRLKRIGLVKCSSITDVSIKALSRPRRGGLPPDSPTSTPSSLERIHLSYCTHLTLAGITSLLNNNPRLSHLSLTGVQAFLRQDINAFVRPPPPEFNPGQREVFCVFSGSGIGQLRQYLNEQQAQELEEARRRLPQGSPDDDDDDDIIMIGSRAPPPPRVQLSLPPPPPPGPPISGTFTMTDPQHVSEPGVHAGPRPAQSLGQRRRSLPLALTIQTNMLQSGRPRTNATAFPQFPTLQMPSSAPIGPYTSPSQLTPTNDAPLSVDEGENFNEMPMESDNFRLEEP